MHFTAAMPLLAMRTWGDGDAGHQAETSPCCWGVGLGTQPRGTAAQRQGLGAGSEESRAAVLTWALYNSQLYMPMEQEAP